MRNLSHLAVGSIVPFLLGALPSATCATTPFAGRRALYYLRPIIVGRGDGGGTIRIEERDVAAYGGREHRDREDAEDDDGGGGGGGAHRSCGWAAAGCGEQLLGA